MGGARLRGAHTERRCAGVVDGADGAGGEMSEDPLDDLGGTAKGHRQLVGDREVRVLEELEADGSLIPGMTGRVEYRGGGIESGRARSEEGVLAEQAVRAWRHASDAGRSTARASDCDRAYAARCAGRGRCGRVRGPAPRAREDGGVDGGHEGGACRGGIRPGQHRLSVALAPDRGACPDGGGSGPRRLPGACRNG